MSCECAKNLEKKTNTFKMENHGIDELSEAVKKMKLNSGLQNDQNILTFEEVQAKLADIEKRASEVHQRVIDDHNALLEFRNKNMRTRAGTKQSENVQKSVVVQSVEISASAVVRGSSVEDSDIVMEEPLIPRSNLDVGDHEIIVNDVVPKPEVESTGGKGWVIFYSSQEEYDQVLEDMGSACNCLEESMLSAVVDVCSRARSFEARVTPTDLSLSFTQDERSSTVAVHESLGFEYADRREIVFDPGGGNAPRRKTVADVPRESSCLGGGFLGGDDFGIERGSFNPTCKIFDPGGRKLFFT